MKILKFIKTCIVVISIILLTKAQSEPNADPLWSIINIIHCIKIIISIGIITYHFDGDMKIKKNSHKIILKEELSSIAWTVIWIMFTSAIIIFKGGI